MANNGGNPKKRGVGMYNSNNFVNDTDRRYSARPPNTSYNERSNREYELRSGKTMASVNYNETQAQRSRNGPQTRNCIKSLDANNASKKKIDESTRVQYNERQAPSKIVEGYVTQKNIGNPQEEAIQEKKTTYSSQPPNYHRNNASRKYVTETSDIKANTKVNPEINASEQKATLKKSFSEVVSGTSTFAGQQLPTNVAVPKKPNFPEVFKEGKNALPNIPQKVNDQNYEEKNETPFVMNNIKRSRDACSGKADGEVREHVTPKVLAIVTNFESDIQRNKETAEANLNLQNLGRGAARGRGRGRGRATASQINNVTTSVTSSGSNEQHKHKSTKDLCQKLSQFEDHNNNQFVRRTLQESKLLDGSDSEKRTQPTKESSKEIKAKMASPGRTPDEENFTLRTKKLSGEIQAQEKKVSSNELQLGGNKRICKPNEPKNISYQTKEAHELHPTAQKTVSSDEKPKIRSKIVDRFIEKENVAVDQPGRYETVPGEVTESKHPLNGSLKNPGIAEVVSVGSKNIPKGSKTTPDVTIKITEIKTADTISDDISSHKAEPAEVKNYKRIPNDNPINSGTAEEAIVGSETILERMEKIQNGTNKISENQTTSTTPAHNLGAQEVSANENTVKDKKKQRKKKKKTLSSNLEDIKKNLQNDKATMELQQLLQEKLSWLTKMHHKTDMDFTLKIISKNEKTGKNSKELKKSITSVFSEFTFPRKTLVVGGAGFGKTRLCSKISRSANEMFGQSGAKRILVLYCSAKDVEEIIECSDICVSLIEIFSNVAKEANLKICMENVLQNSAENILVILEDYDALSPTGKEKVKKFVIDDRLFARAKIVLTTRPCRNDFFEHFDCKISIPSSHVLNLDSIMSANNMEPRSSILFKNLFAELPQQFLLPLKIKSDIHFSDRITLFSALEQVFSYMVHVQDLKRIISQDAESCFIKLGLLCVEGLFKGFMSFTEECLRSSLGDDGFQFIIACNIFYRERDKMNGNVVWMPHCKLFLVFFATKYMRHVWTKKKTLEQKAGFVEKNLCFGVCRGDYVFQNSKVPNMYFVGLLPELVLRFGQKFELDQATIEMCYDSEGTEISKAFNSTNLLFRVGESQLFRFQFRKLDFESEVLQTLFEPFLNSLTFSNLVVTYQFYENVHEDRVFLKVSVKKEEEEKSSLVLQGICKAYRSGEMATTLLEFSYTALKDLSNFVVEILSQYYSSVSLNETFESTSFGDFVYKLVLNLSQCTVGRPTTISCYDKSLVEFGTESKSVTFCLKPSFETCNISVLFISTGSCRLARKSYNEANLRNSQDHLTSILNTFFKKEEDIKFSLEIAETIYC